jgi:transposase
MDTRKPYPTDVSDEEWSFVAPYLTLIDEHAPQRHHDLRELFNALRWLVRAGAPWRLLLTNFPAWPAVYQQTQRWLKAGCFEAIVSDLRSVLLAAQGRQGQPSTVVLDGRTLQSSVESGARAGYDGYKRKRGSKVHIAVDTLGHLLAVHLTPTNEQERSQVEVLAQQVQQVSGEQVKRAYVDQGYTGEAPREAARQAGIDLRVVKLPEVKCGFVLLPKRWVVERNFAWASRFRRMVREYERLPQTLAGIHFVVFAILMLLQAIQYVGNG